MERPEFVEDVTEAGGEGFMEILFGDRRGDYDFDIASEEHEVEELKAEWERYRCQLDQEMGLAEDQIEECRRRLDAILGAM